MGHKPFAMTPEIRKHFSDGQKKPIRCVETGEIFECAECLAKRLGINTTSRIHLACRSGKPYRGLHWKYIKKEEYNNENKKKS